MSSSIPSTTASTLIQEGQQIVFTLENGTRLTAVPRISARARRVRLTLTAAGTLRLTVPQQAPSDLPSVLKDMLPWLERSWKRHIAGLQPPALPDHITLPLLPANFAVYHAGQLREGQHTASLATCGQPTGFAPRLFRQGPHQFLLLEKNSDLLLYGSLTPESLPAAAALLRLWGRHAAEQLLPPLLRRLAASMGITLADIRCRDQRSLWGSCRSTGIPSEARISLNWRAVLLPPELAQHLCLHELCHVGHRGHDAAYHAALERVSPGSRNRERELADAWRTLPWWARHAV